MCEYRTLEAWADVQPEFSQRLEEMLDGPYAKTVFFVVEERDSHLHVVAYQRDRVYKDVAAEVHAA